MVSESTLLTKQYVQHEIEYAKLKVFHQVATVSVGLTKTFAIGVCLLIFTLFASIALSLYLGELVGSVAAGFLIVAGIYLLLGFIAYLMRTKIEKFIVNKLSLNFFG